MQNAERGNILVVDDEASVRTYLSDTLTGAGYRVQTMSEGGSALQLILASPGGVDLLLLDLEMPRMDGFELLNRLRGTDATAHLPAIVLSGFSDRHHKVTGLRLGANDYLVKPVDTQELIARVEAHLRVSRAADVWRRRSRFDSLTGLLSRYGFTERVHAEVERATRQRAELSLAFLDLDGFKAINDRFGHRFGDQVLCSVAAVVEGSLRACDTAGRWGGDELVVALPDTDRARAEKVIERIRERVAELGWGGGPLGVSAGIACLSPTATGDRGRRVERLIEAADRAMYRDKSANGAARVPVRAVGGWS